MFARGVNHHTFTDGTSKARRSSKEDGQVAVVMLLLVGVPLFVFAMAYAVGFGTVYYQRAEYAHAADLSVEAGLTCLRSTQISSNQLANCARISAYNILTQNLNNDKLPIPSPLSISQGYLFPGMPNPCNPTYPITTDMYYMKFTGETKPVFFGQSAFGIGTQKYPVCSMASLNIQGG